MVKKVLLGTLLVGLIGILAAGAVIRTVDKTENVAEARGVGHGQAGDEGSWGFGQSSESSGGRSRGAYGGQNRNAASGNGTGTGQAQVDEWITLQGTVLSIDADALVVQTEDGEVTVENRPWWFAQEQGFSAQPGDQIALIGFYGDAEFEVGRLRHGDTGQTVYIREQSGRPLWAGRGWRSH